MALVRPGALIASISGRVGNCVFTNTKNGVVFAPRARVKSTAQPKQFTPRARFASAVAGWNALTTTQQTAWATAAANKVRFNRLGVRRPLTGRQAYIHEWIAGYYTPSHPSDTPPSQGTAPQITITSAAGGASSPEFIVEWTQPYVAAAQTRTWYIARTFRTTPPTYRHPFKFLTFEYQLDGEDDFGPEIAAALGPGATGEYFQLMARSNADDYWSSAPSTYFTAVWPW